MDHAPTPLACTKRQRLARGFAIRLVVFNNDRYTAAATTTMKTTTTTIHKIPFTPPHHQIVP